MASTSNFRTAWADMVGHFWAGDHIAPMTDRSIPASAWCMAQFSNLIYWHWQMTGDAASAKMLQSHFDWLVLNIGNIADGTNIELVGASDDAAWLAQTYFQVYDACGDQRALDACKALMVSTRTLYAGPGDNAHGLYYTLPNLDADHRSSLYEVGIAIAALNIWLKANQADSETPWFETAVNAYAWMRRDLIHPTGVYFCEFDLNEGDDGYLKPVGCDSPTDTSKSYLGGTMGMAVLASMLFSATGDDTYRQDALAIVNGILSFLVTRVKGRRVLLNNRDAWTEGFYFPAFVQWVLPLDGINPLMKTVMMNTGLAVFSGCRTSDGYYDGDWTGGAGWSQQGEIAQEVMTSANSVKTILAGAMIAKEPAAS